MPLREYVTEDGKRIELLADVGAVEQRIELPDGRVAHLVEVSQVSRTAHQWGDTNQRPHFNRGLGRWVSGEREVARIARERGLIAHRELGTEREVDDALERQLSRERDRSRAEDAEQAEYRENVKRYGPIRAVAETWSASRILNGKTVYAKVD